TAWGNVERALQNLKAAGVLSPSGLYRLPQEALERLLRPAGTYRVKAARLRALLEYLFSRHGGDPTALSRGDWTAWREELLAVPGIGPETADSILLYAAGRPTFVVDAYTRRLLGRLGLLPAAPSYEHIRALFMAHLPPDPDLYGEYHALIVRHGKERCRRRRPRCGDCPLRQECGAFGRAGDEAG
ncbi:MAG: endonuclease III domain-containing protein, partial [Chloroflexia bacterium]